MMRTGCLLIVVFCAATAPQVPAAPPDHALIAGLLNPKSIEDPLRGLLLLGELNCVSCHQAGAAQNLINTKTAPDLAAAARRINPSYMQKFIADPARQQTFLHALADIRIKDSPGEAPRFNHFRFQKSP